MITYTVWVGGVPDIENVNLEEARKVYHYWVKLGYDDVHLEINDQLVSP